MSEKEDSKKRERILLNFFGYVNERPHLLLFYFAFLFLVLYVHHKKFRHLPEGFGTEAFDHMKILCENHRAFATIYEYESRGYLVTQLSNYKREYESKETQKFDVEIFVQHPQNHSHFWDKRNVMYSFHNFTNLFFLIRTKDEFLVEEDNEKKRNRGVVLLNAHYDTGYRSPGCADNGVAVGVLLKSIRRVLFELPEHVTLSHDLIILFSGGEEVGLTGSSMVTHTSFLTEYYIEKGFSPTSTSYIPIVFLNLEAAGVQGKSAILRGSSKWILQEYSKYLKTPLFNVVFRDIFESGILGSDTDYTMFDKKFQGIDLVIYEKSHVYHTGQDTYDVIDPRTVATVGSQVYDFIDTFAIYHDSDFPDFEKIQNGEPGVEGSEESMYDSPVYFDMFQLKLIVLSFGDVRFLYTITLSTTLLYIIAQHLIQYKKDRVRIRTIMREQLVILGLFLGVVGFSFLLGRFCSMIIPMFTYGEHPLVGMVFILLINLVSLSLTFRILSISRCIFNRKKPVSTVSVVVFYSLLMLVTFKYEIGSTMIFYMFVVFMVPADLLRCLISRSVKKKRERDVLKICNVLLFLTFCLFPVSYLLYLLEVSYICLYGFGTRVYLGRIFTFDAFISVWCAILTFLIASLTLPYFNYSKIYSSGKSRKKVLLSSSFKPNVLFVFVVVVCCIYVMYYFPAIYEATSVSTLKNPHYPYTPFGQKRAIMEQVHHENWNRSYFSMATTDILELDYDTSVFTEIRRRFPLLKYMDQEQDRVKYWRYLISQISLRKPFWMDDRTPLGGNFVQAPYPSISISKMLMDEEPKEETTTTRYEIEVEGDKDVMYYFVQLRVKKKENGTSRMTKWSYYPETPPVYKEREDENVTVVLEVFGFGTTRGEPYNKNFNFWVDVERSMVEEYDDDDVLLEICAYYSEQKYFSSQMNELDRREMPELYVDAIPIVITISERFLN